MKVTTPKWTKSPRRDGRVSARVVRVSARVVRASARVLCEHDRAHENARDAHVHGHGRERDHDARERDRDRARVHDDDAHDRDVHERDHVVPWASRRWLVWNI